MKAAWYEQQGSPSEALIVGEIPIPEPGDGEVRIRVAASGVNPGDVKKRQDAFGLGMPYPRVIPHSDGAGVIDKIGRGVSESRLGERVWCYGAQSYRPFGTAAEYVALPSEQAVTLDSGMRHRSAARYTWDHHHTVAFVVSEDGPVTLFRRGHNIAVCMAGVDGCD